MTTTARILTVLLPCFGLQVKARREPELRQRAVVLLDASGRVAECSRRALAAGVREGQTQAQARAACPDVVLTSPEDEEMARARREVLEALLLVGPRVEWGGGGTFHLDATGLSAFHRSEHALVVRCWQSIEELGLTARVGCASTRFVSLLAARARVAATVPTGGESDFVRPLPLSLLQVTEDVLRRLGLLGVRTLGDFARLPSDGLADRFGAQVALWQRRVKGEEPRPVVGAEDPRGPRVLRELDEPVSGLEPVVFLLKSSCEELADELERRGTCAAVLRLEIALDVPSGQPREDVREIRPSRPLASARALMELCRTELEARPLAAPLLGLALTAFEEAPAQAASGELFGRSVDPGALLAAVDQVRALLGDEAVVTPAPRPAHRREARVAWKGYDPRVALEPPAPADASAQSGVVAERILHRPVPALVRLAAAGDVGVLEIPARDAEKLGGLPERTEVLDQQGPIRVAGEWWSGGADVDRDEYLLLGGDGGLYRACRDRRTRSWYLMGLVD